MRCNTPPPPRPPPEKKPKVFTHIYLHDTVPCKRHRRVQQESGFAGTAAAAAWLSWFNLQLAGRVSLTGKSSVVFCFFFVSFMSETGQGRSSSMVFPPRAAVYEPHLADKYFTTTTSFSAVITCTHVSLLLF